VEIQNKISNFKRYVYAIIALELFVKMFLYTVCDTATQYTCIEGGCIEDSQVCDGNVDCPYITGTTVSDDEWFCSEFNFTK